MTKLLWPLLTPVGPLLTHVRPLLTLADLCLDHPLLGGALLHRPVWRAHVQSILRLEVHKRDAQILSMYINRARTASPASQRGFFQQPSIIFQMVMMLTSYLARLFVLCTRALCCAFILKPYVGSGSGRAAR